MEVDAGSDLQVGGAALPPLAAAAVAGVAGDPMLPMKRAAPEPEMAAPEPEVAPPPLLPVPEAHVTAEEGHFAAAQAQVAAAWEAAAPVTFAPEAAAGPVVPMAAQGLVSMAAAVAVSVTDGPPGKRPRGRAPNGVDGRPKLWDAKKGIWVDQTDPDAANVPDTWDEKMKKNAERQKQRRERGDWNPQDEECCAKYTKNTLKSSRIKGDPMLAGMLENHKAVPATPFWRMLCSNDYHTTRREITNFRSRQQQKAKKAAAAGLAAAGPLMALPYAG